MVEKSVVFQSCLYGKLRGQGDLPMQGGLDPKDLKRVCEVTVPGLLVPWRMNEEV